MINTLMKWFILVIFAATSNEGSYLFTLPEFDSEQQCKASIVNPQHIAVYGQNIISTFGYPVPIRAVICINEKDRQDLENLNKGIRES